jgi:hypothetical protein
MVNNLPKLISAVVPLLSIITSLGCTVCNDSVMVMRDSPDKTTTAKVCLRNCGATTDYATYLRLSRRGPLGLVLKETTIAIIDQKVQLVPHWKSNRDLFVKCLNCKYPPRLLQLETRWESVSITYLLGDASIGPRSGP